MVLIFDWECILGKRNGWSDTDLKGGIYDDTGSSFTTVIAIGLNSEKTDAASICADAATGPIWLTPRSSTGIYYKLTNGTLTSLDSGASTTVNIFAGKAGAPQSVTVTGVS